MVYYYNHPKNAIQIFDKTVAEGIADGVDKVVTRQDNLEKQIVRNRFSSDYHSFLNDRGPHLREQTALAFAEWCAACKEDHTVSYVESLPTLIYISPTEGKAVFYNKGGLKMAYIEGKFNFRDTGRLAHKAHNLEKRATDAMTSPEGTKFRDEHSDSLNKAPNIDYIVIGELDDAIYGVAKISKDGAILFGNTNSYKMMREWAKRTGADVDYLIRRGMLEEFRHLAIGSKRGSVEEEIIVRVGLIDLYRRLAEMEPDQKARAKYMDIVRNLEKDLSTVRERYSRSYSNNLQALVELYCTDISELEAVLEKEASEKGLRGEELRDYVDKMMDKIAETAEDYEKVQDDKEDSDSEEGKGNEAVEAEDAGGEE